MKKLEKLTYEVEIKYEYSDLEVRGFSIKTVNKTEVETHHVIARSPEKARLKALVYADTAFVRMSGYKLVSITVHKPLV